jgi:site-specific DNA recombinase
MVLPDRIELSTSPLPRECSTTELRQQKQRVAIPGGAPKRAETAIRVGTVQGKLGRPVRLLRSGPVRYHRGMTKHRSDGDEKGSNSGGNAPPKPVADRKERLSDALRANLARRKGQARARKDATPGPADSQGPSAGYGGTAEAPEPAETTHDSAGFIPDKPSS